MIIIVEFTLCGVKIEDSMIKLIAPELVLVVVQTSFPAKIGRLMVLIFF
jgi:hypothetical protein